MPRALCKARCGGNQEREDSGVQQVYLREGELGREVKVVKREKTNLKCRINYFLVFWMILHGFEHLLVLVSNF